MTKHRAGGRAGRSGRTRAGWIVPVRLAGLAGLLAISVGTASGLVMGQGVSASASTLPVAPVWTSTTPYAPHRPASCSTATKKSETSSPTSGEPSSSTGSVPWPAAPAGTDPADYAAYLHTPTATPPVRPSNWDHTGGTWKLTSARTNPSDDPTLAKNPQELCGVEGGSVDTAWQTTTGQPSTLIAVTDSGIEWCDPGIVDKIYVNPAAVPPPENAAGATKAALEAAGTTFTDTDLYDLDDSGVVNAAQYTTDPRVLAVAADYGGLFCSVKRGTYGPDPGAVSPMDLIRAFGTPTLPTGASNPYYYGQQSPSGFTEAISGWNFVDNDNNAYDDVHYDHGTGEAEDSSGAANTLGQEVGACPNCLILPVRVGDSFITSGNEFAQAVLFAVDSGATVVQEALGTENITESDRQAVAYAADHGVPVVASAADEEAEHHNLPAVLPNTIVVNSVTKNTSYKPPSYLYLNGCTNYGANISVSVESASCSSEATGKASGIVGLAESAAANAVAAGTIQSYPGLTNVDGQPVPLSVNEISQLVTMSASAVNFATAAPPYGSAENYSVTTGPLSTNPLTKSLVKTTRYPSHAGFNQYFGYGRINAAAIVTWISHGKIPPESDVTSPTWFDIDSPTGQLQVTGTVGTPSSLATSWRYQVDVGVGPTPKPGTWHMVATGTGSGVRTGTLADVTMAQVAALFPAGTDFSGGPVSTGGTPDADKFTFSVQVVVQATSGPTNGMIGMSRRADYIHGDQSTLSGFPQQLSSSIDASPTLAPIGPGGTNVLLVATSGGTIEALEPNGSELPGFPVHTDPLPYHTGEAAFTSEAVTAVPRGEITGGVAVGDLADAGGSTLDVVTCDLTGRCYAWNAQGQLLPGFPVETDPTYSSPTAVDADNTMLPGIASSPALADLTGNGTLDVVAASMDRHVYAWQPTGKSLPGWPVLAVDPSKVSSVNPKTDEITFLPTVKVAQGTSLMDTPAIGNLSGGTGPPDVIVGSDEEYTGPANADLTGALKLFAGTLTSANASVFAIYPDGTLHAAAPSAPSEPAGTDPQAFLPGWPTSVADLKPGLLPLVGDGVTASPTLADVSGNGDLDVGVMSAAGPAYVLKPTGASALGNGATGKPIVMTTGTQGAQSNSTGTVNTSIGALGGPVFAPLGQTAPGVSLVAPAASLGELVNEGYAADQSPSENQVDAWDASTGTFDAGFPQQMNDLQFLASPIVADVGGDSTPYVVEGSGTYDLRALDADGKEAPGFPKFTGGWMVNSPSYGSFGSLGGKVLAAGTREGYLFVWTTTTPACATSGPWPQDHHDLWNTGNLDESGAPTTPASTPSCTTGGYWEVASDGGVFSFGDAQFYGSMGGQPLNAPVVGIAATSDREGYWEVASDGGVFSFGDAHFYGSMGGQPLNAPVVGMAATPGGGGYWEVAADGGVFSFGSATFYGSMGGQPLNAPVVGIVAAPGGGGYWEVAADGGVFSFGDAQFYGSMGGQQPLNAPVVGIVAAPGGGGYWEVAGDGGIFAFGDARFYGSMGGQPLNAPVVGMGATSDGNGYWEVAGDGGIFAFGDARFYGSMGGQPLNAPVVGMARE